MKYQRITIVGGGTAGYLAVAYLCRMFPERNIRWIYPAENSPIGVGEATLPDMVNFLDEIGISSDDIINHCNGSIKCGFRFDGFSGVTKSYFHSFSLHDERCRQERVPDNILQLKSGIGLHFEVTALIALIESRLQAHKNLTVIRSTVSYSDVKDTADIVIDCTGLSRQIIKDIQPEDNFISLLDRIPNNAALVYRHKYTDPLREIKQYSIGTAMEYGWVWNIFLRREMTLGYVHPDRYDVKEEFINFLEKSICSKIDHSKIRKVNFTTGRNKIHLVDSNPPVVAIGLSSCFIEPMESTSLFITIFGIRLIRQYINGEVSALEFNALINREYESIANFVLAHYKYTNRCNEYWDSYKSIPIENYAISECFDTPDWDHILIGMGHIQPTSENLAEVAVRKLSVRKEQLFSEWLSSRGYG